MTDALKICHDRILPRDEDKPRALMPSATPGGKTRAIAPDIRKLWVNGSTLRVRFMGGTPAQHELARKQAAWWSDHANLSFAFGNDADAEIRISFDTNDGAWSYIGTDCASIPLEEATMNLGFLDGGTCAHEFGHAIGLGHEHQNPDGGIRWKDQVVIRDLSGPPNNWTAAQIRHNVLEKYQMNSFMRGSTFDPASIMLYAFPGTWTESGVGTEANHTLSTGDVTFASTNMYPGKVKPPVALVVNGPPVMAEIGKRAEEDVFQFTVSSARRHIIETGGQTDVVMKLFGPDSQTRLAAEDDDSGDGLNAKIAQHLAPGVYLVQVRHYHRSQGTGQYSISVKAQG